jgi:hypothetical protein
MNLTLTYQEQARRSYMQRSIARGQYLPKENPSKGFHTSTKNVADIYSGRVGYIFYYSYHTNYNKCACVNR